MTTLNELNQTIFKTGATIEMILTFAILNGVNEAENVIRNTYLKTDAEYIISIINSLS